MGESSHFSVDISKPQVLKQLERVGAEDVVCASASSNTILKTLHPVHLPATGAIMLKNMGYDFGVSAIDTIQCVWSYARFDSSS